MCAVDIKKQAPNVARMKILGATALTASKLEGIIPAIESAHAVAYAIKLAKKWR